MSDKRFRYAIGIGGCVAILGIAQAQAGRSGVMGIIIETSRSFGIQQVTLRPGGSVVLSNEDSTAVHHPVIESGGIMRDFGDQEPGSHTTMTFHDRGTFEVMCGIHPKMKLKVVVE